MDYVEVIKSCDVRSECPRAHMNIFVILLTACAVECLMYARFVEFGPWKYSKRGFLRTATIITVLGRLYAWSNWRSWGGHVLRRASRAHHVKRRRHLEDLSNPSFFLTWHKKPAPRLRSLPFVVRDWDGNVCAWGVCVGSSFTDESLIKRPVISDIFGIADLTRPQLPKCNNHLVSSFIKVDGLSIVHILSSLNQERWSSAT